MSRKERWFYSHINDVVEGGTGSSLAAQARINLGLEIGADVQAWDDDLDDIAALSPTDDYAMIGDGTGWTSRRILGTDVEVSELSTATYDDVQDFINFFGNRTLLSGGTITAHGDADGSVAIAACTAWCKESNSDTAVGKFFDYAGKAKQTLTDLHVNLIYLDYNTGTPQIVVATTPVTYGFQQDHILIGVVFQQGNAVHIFQSSNVGIQGINRAFMHAVEHHGAHRSSGLVTTDGGSLALSITAGIIYTGLNRQATTVDGSTWSYWYTSDSGSTWTEDTSQSVLVQSYNNIASGKVSLTSNRFGVHWVYVDYEGTHLHLVYGQGDYTANQSEEAAVPSVLPPIVVGYGVLIAKIINQEGTNTLTITYPWTTVFTSSLATDHGSLAGLADDDHTHYLLADGTRELTDDLAVANFKTIDGVDISAHNGAVTGVHGVGAETILHTGNVGTMAAETATDYLLIADLENPPTEDESAKAPTSEWAYDHDAATTGIHGVGSHSITAATTAAITLYVDAGSGNDSNAGTSGSPKATIKGALDVLPIVIAHTCTICVRGQQDYPEDNTALEFSRFNTLTYIVIKTVNSSDEDMYDHGLASAGGNDTLTDDANGKSWSVDQFNGAFIWIYAGTGAGQVRTISDTTATVITVSANWDTNPDNTSYYAIGGGATLTGTNANHLTTDGKKVNLYGFKHTGATNWCVYDSNMALGSVYYNYFHTAFRGVISFNYASIYCRYNYSAASDTGFQVQLAAMQPRANVITGATWGVKALYNGIAQMYSVADRLNYIDNCTTGISLQSGGACTYANNQVFNACGADIDPAVSTTVPTWYT